MVAPLVVAGILAGAGALAGGAAGSKLGSKSPQYTTTQWGYVPDYTAGHIGGTSRLDRYTNINDLSDQELINYIASGQAGPELQEQYRQLGNELRPGTEYDANGNPVWYDPNDPRAIADSAAVDETNRRMVEQARGQLAGQDLVTGWEDVANAELWGQQDREAGGQLLQQGLDYKDRAAAQAAFGDMGFESGLANTSRNAATAQLASQVGANASRSAAQRSANQLGTDYDRMVAAYGASLGQQQVGLNQGNAQLGYMQDVMLGRAGPSLAELQSNRVLGEQVANQMAMAKSGAAFSPAAQRQAAVVGGQLQGQQRQQLAELRAAEQMQAQQQVNQLIAQQQAAGQAYGSTALGGADQLAGLSATRTGLAQNLYGQDVGLYGMERSALQNQEQMDYNRLLGMTGYDVSKAQTNAQLTDAQRARDDAMRQYLGNIGLQTRAQGYTLLANQAANNLGYEQLRVQENQSDLNRGSGLDQFNASTYNANRPDVLGGFAAGLGGTASILAATQGGGAAAASPAPQAAYGPAYSDASSNPQGWNYSDERSKQIIAEKDDTIAALLRAMSPQGNVPTGDFSKAMTPQEAADSRYLDQAERDTLRGLAGQQAPEWTYTTAAREAAPDKTGPGPRIGYTTRQLKQAGPVGRAMVAKDPNTGLEMVDQGAASSFSMAALGDLQRQNDELKRRLAELERGM